MIVFDLECRAGSHRFEGWFGSSDDFARQQQRGLVSCPVCGSSEVGKAVMAPNVGRKGNQLPAAPAPAAAAPAPVPVPASAAPPLPPAAVMANGGPPLSPEAVALFRALATAQAEALKVSRWVGEDLAESARAMHYGEAKVEPIHGQATIDEARELLEEGIDIAPILFPVAPPGEAN